MCYIVDCYIWNPEEDTGGPIIATAYEPYRYVGDPFIWGSRIIVSANPEDLEELAVDLSEGGLRL